MTLKKTVSVKDRIAELVAEHGSYRAAADAIGIGFTHLHRMRHGTKRLCAVTLKKLGLDAKTECYERLPSKPARGTK